MDPVPRLEALHAALSEASFYFQTNSTNTRQAAACTGVYNPTGSPGHQLRSVIHAKTCSRVIPRRERERERPAWNKPYLFNNRIGSEASKGVNIILFSPSKSSARSHLCVCICWKSKVGLPEVVYTCGTQISTILFVSSP